MTFSLAKQFIPPLYCITHHTHGPHEVLKFFVGPKVWVMTFALGSGSYSCVSFLLLRTIREMKRYSHGLCALLNSLSSALSYILINLQCLTNFCHLSESGYNNTRIF